MKTKSLKKLALSKSTIGKLNDKLENSIKGGGSDFANGCLSNSCVWACTIGCEHSKPYVC